MKVRKNLFSKKFQNFAFPRDSGTKINRLSHNAEYNEVNYCTETKTLPDANASMLSAVQSPSCNKIMVIEKVGSSSLVVGRREIY